MNADYERKFTLLAVIWFSMSLSTPVTHAMGYDTQGFFFRLIITGCMLALFVFYGAYPLLPSVFLLFLAAAAFLFHLFFPLLFEKISEFIILYFTTNETIIFILVIAVVTLLLLIILTKLKRNLLVLFLIGVFVFIPLWYLYIDSAYTAAVYYALCWFLLLSYQSGNKIWNRLNGFSRSELRDGWINYTSWVLFFMVMTALLLPKNIPPVPWNSFQVWTDKAFPFLSELRGGKPHNTRGSGSSFEMYMAGFGEEGQLGGPLKQDKTILMEIKGSGGGRHYLRGSTKIKYTGSSWITTGRQTEWEPAEVDTPIKSYIRPLRLNITHKRLNTNTVFTLPYTTGVSHVSGPLSQTEGDCIITPESVPLDQSYTIYGMSLRYRTDFSEMENGVPTVEFDSWLTLPDNLPARVIELAESVTAEKHGYYAKMRTLERYLRATYTYNISPPLLPDNRDFVDFFLFEVKSGYCTSFASALAVMGRSLGIPTRYVQGFVMPEASDSKGIYHIAGTNAHSWVEAYIPGIGWMIFEATPGFPTTDTLPAAAPIYSDDEYEPEPDTPKPAEPDNRKDPAVEEDYIPSIYLRLFGFILIALLFMFIALVAAVVIRRRQRIKNMFRHISQLPPRLQASAYYNMVLPLLAGIHLGKRPGETPLEYSERINRQVSDWKLDFIKISKAMNHTLYSKNGETPDWAAEQMKAFFELIFRRYMVFVGKPTAFVEIYLQKKYFSNEVPF